MTYLSGKYWLILWSSIIFITVHAVPVLHWYQRQLMRTGEMPYTERYRMNTAQRAYSAASEGHHDRAVLLWKQHAAIHKDAAYNLGTYLSIEAIYSGSTLDIAQLTEAERYLSWAADLDLTNNTHILHNLAAVRARLDTLSGEQQADSVWLPLLTTWSVPENVPTSWWWTTLSEMMKQQLTDYKENLEETQATYQWWFGKLPPSTGTNSWQKDR